MNHMKKKEKMQMGKRREGNESKEIGGERRIDESIEGRETK